MKQYKKECIFAPFFKLLEATFELLVPLIVASIVDVGIKTEDKGYIVKMCFLLVAFGEWDLSLTAFGTKARPPTALAGGMSGE